MGAFGEKLRKQREQRGIELDAISNTTKISTRMLRALEDEHFDQLPGGVFNKGFVRAYARQVGLNEEEAVSDYLTALRENQIQQQSILPEFRDVRDNALRNNDGRKQDLHGNDRRSHDPAPGSNDHRDQLLREDRRKQGRRDEDRRNDRRDNDPRNNDRVISDLREDGNRPQNKDLPPRLVSAMPAPPASPPRERFPKKYPAGSPEQSADGSSAQIPWNRLAAALLVVTLALALWSSHRKSEPGRSEPTTSSHNADESQPAPGPAPVAALAAPATQSSSAAGSPKVEKSPPAQTSSAGTASAGTAPPPSTSPSPTLPGASASASSGKVASSAASSTPSTTGSANKTVASPIISTTNSPVAKATAPTAAAKPARTFTLLIRAEKTTWVSIIADGKPVAEETLIAPAHTSIRATSEVVVKIGNATGVSFLLNGKEIPAQGSEGEVKTYTFDATGVRGPETQPPDPNR